MQAVTIRHPNLILGEVNGRAEFLKKLTDPDAKPCASLEDFEPRKHVKDRKVLKSISHRDAYSIAAAEQLKKELEENNHLNSDADKRGMFVGAPPSSMGDYDNYLRSVNSCMDMSGLYHEKLFGGQCMSSRPTTLLLGLPNNVLCYGSMLLDSRGPNNNFVSEGVSSAHALQSAKRSLDMQRTEQVFVAGYSDHSSGVKLKTYDMLNRTGETVFSDGAGIVEMTGDPKAKGIKYFGSVFSSSKEGDRSSSLKKLRPCIKELLDKNNLGGKDSIQLLLNCNEEKAKEIEIDLRPLMEEYNLTIVLFPIEEKFGYLAEMSGLTEIAALSAIKGGSIEAINFNKGHIVSTDSIKNAFTLIVSNSYDGDLAVSLLR